MRTTRPQVATAAELAAFRAIAAVLDDIADAERVNAELRAVRAEASASGWPPPTRAVLERGA